jgi:hypothetical protein
MRKYTGDDLFSAIGEIDERLLSVPSAKRVRASAWGKAAIAASIALCFAVITVFYVNVVLGGSNSADGNMGNDAAPPADNAPSLDEGWTDNNNFGGSSGDVSGDGDNGNFEPEGSPDAPNHGDNDNSGEGSSEPADLIFSKDGTLLNYDDEFGYLYSPNGYFTVILAPSDTEVRVLDSESGTELSYELLSTGHRIYTLQGCGKIVMLSDSYNGGQITVSYQREYDRYYFEINYKN